MENGPIWFLGVAVIVNAVAWFFKSPKESHGEMAKRVDELEDSHHALDKDYAGFRAEMLGEIRNLADAVNRLAAAVGHMGVTTGEHRVLRK